MPKRAKMLFRHKESLFPFCTRCNDWITGSPNGQFGYRCMCGTWSFDFKMFRYKLTKYKNGENP